MNEKIDHNEIDHNEVDNHLTIEYRLLYNGLAYDK